MLENVPWILVKNVYFGGTWVALSVTCLTLGFGSGHDLKVPEFKPQVRLHADKEKPGWDFLSVPLPYSCFHSLSLKMNK